MSQEYIHINKACKKYSKSRQTFYNYMNKWRVKHKKVHNKVFLDVQDIENVLSDTQEFDSPRLSKSPEVLSPSNNNSSVIKSQDIDMKHTSDIKAMHKTKKWMDDMHTSLSTHIDMTAQDLRKDTTQKIRIATQSIEEENLKLRKKMHAIQEELDISKKQNNIHQFIYIFALIAVIISLVLWFFGN